MRVLSEEEAEEYLADKTLDPTPPGSGALIYEGAAAPYDSASNCYYISQSTETDHFTGTLTAAQSDASLLIVDAEGTLKNKNDTLAGGTPVAVYIVHGDTFQTCQVLFTGLPVLSISSSSQDASVSKNGSVQYRADAELFAPLISDNSLTSAVRVSSCVYHISASGETVSLRFLKEDGVSDKKISLMNMGKDSEWKITAISDQDPVLMRSMLAVWTWNTVNEDERLDVPCAYVEYIQDGVYQGIRLLTPEPDRSEKQLQAEDGTKPTVMEADAANATGYIVNAVNSADYLLFLQITDAVKNAEDDFYLVSWDGLYYSLMPGKIEYAFGIFPHRYNYMAWSGSTRMIAQDLYSGEIGMDFGTYLERTRDRWNALRSDDLSDASVLAQVDELRTYLDASGVTARLQAQEIDVDAETASLKQYLQERLDCMERYYDE